APPAPDGAVDEVRVADIHPVHARAERFDPAGVLVTECERGRDRSRRVRSELPVDRGVGVARARAGDGESHLAGTRFRSLHLFEPRERLPVLEDDSPHGRTLLSTGHERRVGWCGADTTELHRPARAVDRSVTAVAP